MNDPVQAAQHGVTWVQVAGPVGTVLLALLSWSLLRNIKGVDKSVGGVATKVDALQAKVNELSATTAVYGERLAQGNTRFEAIEKAVAVGDAAVLERVKDIEERERQRGCFGGCALTRPSHTPIPPRQG